MKLVMGTRGSALALAQSRMMARALAAAHSGLQVEERIVRTTGDKQQGQPLPQIGGKGVFTLEIESALLDGAIDFAVHSLKDLPPQMPAGLCLAAVPQRASAGDALILHPRLTEYSGLPSGAHIGTSSLRRAAQLLAQHPGWRVSDIRGNIDTRLRKLADSDPDNGGWHAIVLARAGLERLELLAGIAPQRLHFFDERVFVPAPGQGALAIQARVGDERVLQLLSALEDEATRAEIEAERAVVRALDAGCSTPLGARAVIENGELRLWSVILSADGARRIEAQTQGARRQAQGIGERVAQELLRQGAGEMTAATNR